MSRLIARMRAENASAALGDTAAEDELGVTLANDKEAVEQDAAAVAETNTGIENALEAQTEVQAAISTMEESVEDGGLTPREAEMVEARMERAAILLGDNLSNYGLTFRRESFGGRESRLSATKRRIEAAEGWGTKIWNAIKAAWQWIKDQFHRLMGSMFKSTEALRERFDGLEARLNAAEGNKQKESKLSSGAKLFSIEGKTSHDTMKRLLEASCDYSKAIVVIAKVAESKGLGDLDREYENNSAGNNGNALVVKYIDEIVGAVATHLPQRNIEIKGEEKTKTSYYGLLPNDRTLALVKSSNTSEGSGIMFDTFTSRVLTVSEKQAEDYEALTKDQIRSLINAGKVSLTALEEFKKVENAIKMAADANIKYIDEMAKVSLAAKADSEKEQTNRKKFANDAMKVFRARQAIIKTSMDLLPKENYNVVNGLINVVLANISNFKKED